jgi:hypothetical protein
MTVKSCDFISIFLVNVFANALSMSTLCGLGKTRLHVTKQKGREEVANFKVIFQNLPGDTEDNHEKPVRLS